jgi:hypothetical protein
MITKTGANPIAGFDLRREKTFSTVSRMTESAPAAKSATVPTTVPLSPRAREVIDGVKERTGVAKVEAVARLCEWFAKQTEQVQAAILHGTADAASILANEEIARRLAAGDRAPVTLADGLAQASAMIQQLIDVEKALRPNVERAVRDAAAKSTSKK